MSNFKNIKTLEMVKWSSPLRSLMDLEKAFLKDFKR